MNTEQKAKAYDEALEKAIKLQENSNGMILKKWLWNIFPELKENEDERIRKAIIATIHLYYGEPLEDEAKEMIAWLEKQGEKPQGKSALEAINEEKVDNQNCVKPTDNVEPKFKVGDWITNGKCTWKIDSIDEDMYYINHCGIDCGGDIKSIDKEYHLWTLQDAKDGDVLSFDNDTIVIFKDLYNATTFHSYCHIEDGVFDISKDDMPDWWEGKGFHPATKEQRDILFQKMKEAGYEWDANTKELKKIEQKSQRMISAEAKEAMYDKPVCSEEDELVIKYIEEAITNYWQGQSQEYFLDYLKSLKQRIKGE